MIYTYITTGHSPPSLSWTVATDSIWCKYFLINVGYMGMDQYLLIPFLGEWTSILTQLFWCNKTGVLLVLTHPHVTWPIQTHWDGRAKKTPKTPALQVFTHTEAQFLGAKSFFLSVTASHKHYPLVIWHSYGKWPIYRWFTVYRLKMVDLSMAMLNNQMVPQPNNTTILLFMRACPYRMQWLKLKSESQQSSQKLVAALSTPW